MIKVIISGHGIYGEGILSSVETIIGSTKIEVLNFLDDYDDFVLKATNLVKNNVCICICDLLGGTPYNVFAKLSLNNDIHVVTGISVLAIIESLNYLENDVKDVIAKLLENSRNSINYFEVKKIKINETDGGI